VFSWLNDSAPDTLLQIKISTIQYARRQRTWINNSLVQKCQQVAVPVIRLNLFSSASVITDPPPITATAIPDAGVIPTAYSVCRTEFPSSLITRNSSKSYFLWWNKSAKRLRLLSPTPNCLLLLFPLFQIL
jgi:hypothetical protein